MVRMHKTRGDRDREWAPRIQSTYNLEARSINEVKFEISIL